MRKVSDKGQTGVVMSVEKRHAVVMMPGGEFRRMVHGGEPLEIGQSIWVADPVQRRTYAMALAPVAAAALVVVWLSPWQAQPALAAVVSVDINPSINLNVNASGRVLSAQGMDAAGRRLLSGEHVRGKSIGAAVKLLVEQAAHQGYFLHQSAPTVLLGAVFVHKPLSWFPAVSRQTAAVLKTDHVPARVIAVSGVSAPLVKEMQKPDVSVGRYLVWKESQHHHHASLSIEKANRLPVDQLVKPVLPSPSVSPSSTPSSSPSLAPSSAASHGHVVHHHGHVGHQGHEYGGAWPNVPVTLPSVTIELPSQNHGEAGDGQGRDHTQSPGTPPSTSISIPGVPSGHDHGHHGHGHGREGANPSEPVVSVSIPVPSLPGGDGHHGRHGHQGHGHGNQEPSVSVPVVSISIPVPSFPGGHDHHDHHGHHGHDHSQQPKSSDPIVLPSFPGGFGDNNPSHSGDASTPPSLTLPNPWPPYSQQ